MFKDVTHITPEVSGGKGIRALVLDIDNTLTADRSQELPDEVAGWLAQMKEAGIGLTIVSNGAEKRVRPFAEKLGLAYLYRAAKPLPFCADGGTAPHGREAPPDGHGGRPALRRPHGGGAVRHSRADGHPPRAGLGRTGHPETQVGKKSTGKSTTTGEVRPCERDMEHPVRHRRHQRQLCRPRLQKQLGRAGVHRQNGAERL